MTKEKEMVKDMEYYLKLENEHYRAKGYMAVWGLMLIGCLFGLLYMIARLLLGAWF